MGLAPLWRRQHQHRTTPFPRLRGAIYNRDNQTDEYYDLDGIYQTFDTLEEARRFAEGLNHPTLEGVPTYEVGDKVTLYYGDRELSGTVGYVGEHDVRIDGTGPYSWGNQVVKREHFKDGLRHDDRNAELFTPEAAAPATGNYRITDEALGVGNARAKFRYNVEAIRTLKQIEAEGNLGFSTGNLLEPSCGVGSFFGLLPERMATSRLYGVELDSISGRIATQLYPQANITVRGFEKTNFPDGFFDVAIGNVPFGGYKVVDSRYDRQNLLIHEYFLAKSIDKVRPGGVLAFITSNGISGGTMDKKDKHVREYLAEC